MFAAPSGSKDENAYYKRIVDDFMFNRLQCRAVRGDVITPTYHRR